MEGRFVEEDVLYRRTFCKGGRFVEGCLVEGRFVGRMFCSEGRFVEGRFVQAPNSHSPGFSRKLRSFCFHGSSPTSKRSFFIARKLARRKVLFLAW